MRIEILNTGTELLLGNTVNTHGSWLGKELFALGLRVERQTTVPDGEAIREEFSVMVKRADVLLVTGGLGPTSDDLTREIVAETLGLELHEDELALRTLKEFFARRNKAMVDANLRQVKVPTGADVLPNPNGTAPGLYLPPRINGKSECAVFLLPGPPRELYPMFHAEVAPRLKAMAGIHHSPLMVEIKLSGIGESELHDQIDARLAAISGLEHGYCARLGELDLRLIGEAEVLAEAQKIVLEHFPSYIINTTGKSLEAEIVSLLAENGQTVAIAESCTGGLVASRVTDVPGASAVFEYGWVTYADFAKTKQLGVTEEKLAENGAVSEEVAREMAFGALENSGADYAIAVTGIAGPGGGSASKPVGTAWLSVAIKASPIPLLRTKLVFHPHSRSDFKRLVSQSALMLLLRALRE